MHLFLFFGNLCLCDIKPAFVWKTFVQEHISCSCSSHFGHDSAWNRPLLSLVRFLFSNFSLKDAHGLHSCAMPSWPCILCEPGKQESKIKLKLIFQSISCLYLPCHLIITFGFLHLESLYTHTVITLEYISVLINKVPLYCNYMHIASLYIWTVCADEYYTQRKSQTYMLRVIITEWISN